MRILARFLLVFMALRLLAPPGVCVCELLRPVERLFADAFGGPQAPAHCDEEDPVNGCTICQLPPGVEVKHFPKPAPPAPSAEPTAPLESAVPPTQDSVLDDAARPLPSNDRSLYLRHCAFLI